MGRKRVLTIEQEGNLIQRIKRFGNVSIRVISSMLGRYACEFCAKNNLKTSLNSNACSGGKDWMKAFFKQNTSVAQRRAQYMNLARTSSE